MRKLHMQVVDASCSNSARVHAASRAMKGTKQKTGLWPAVLSQERGGCPGRVLVEETGLSPRLEAEGSGGAARPSPGFAPTLPAVHQEAQGSVEENPNQMP
jgi:hypothetical protein